LKTLGNTRLRIGGGQDDRRVRFRATAIECHCPRGTLHRCDLLFIAGMVPGGPSATFERSANMMTLTWAPFIRTECCACLQNARQGTRSEEHTSELQSHVNLVCRLLLEK